MHRRLKRVYEMDNISQEKAHQKSILNKPLFWANYGEHLKSRSSPQSGQRMRAKPQRGLPQSR